MSEGVLAERKRERMAEEYFGWETRCPDIEATLMKRPWGRRRGRREVITWSVLDGMLAWVYGWHSVT